MISANGYEIDQSIDRDKPIRTQIQWIVIVRRHQAKQTLHTIIYIQERPGLLLTVTPNLDFAAISG